MYHPSRGGVRGGKDQFKWEDIKSDKDRENFIGHSVMAPVGRWQKGKDLTWYAKDKKSKAQEALDLQTELKRVKDEEERLMNEALGLVPRQDDRVKLGEVGKHLDNKDKEQLFKRREKEEGEEEGSNKGERVKGIGFEPGLAARAKAAVMKDLNKDITDPGWADVKLVKLNPEEVQKLQRGSSSSSDSESGDDSDRKDRKKSRERKSRAEKKEERHRRREIVKEKVKEGKKAAKRRHKEERTQRKKLRREERAKNEKSD